MFAFQKTKQNYIQDGEKLAFVYLWMDAIQCMVIFMKLFLCQAHVVRIPLQKRKNFKTQQQKQPPPKKINIKNKPQLKILIR